MEFPMDDDARAVSLDRYGNHTLIQWLSWCIWRTHNPFEDMPPHLNRTEHFVNEQITGREGKGWTQYRITDWSDYK